MYLTVSCHRCNEIKINTCSCKFISNMEDGEKRANIFHDGKGYIVDLIENSNLKETREVYAHSIHYAEDVAYNWVSGLIKL